MTHQRFHHRRLAASLFAAVGLALLPACEQEDAAADALKSAQIKLTALTSSGSATAKVEAKQQTLNQIITALRPAVTDGTPAEKAAANLILARAYAGLAESAAEETAHLEHESQTNITRARGLFSTWSATTSQADALTNYDPAPELGAIKAENDALVATLKSKEAEKAAVEAEVNDLAAQAKAKADAVQAKRMEAASVRAKAATLPPSQAEAVIKDAARLTREGDALEVELADLETKSAQIAPRIGEFQSDIDTINRQQALNVQTGEQVNAKAEQADKDAAALTKRASDLASELATVIAETLKHRTDVIAPAFKSAIDQYTQAATSARGGQEASRTQAAGAAAQAWIAVGDIQWNHAIGLENTAALLATIASAKPSVADAGSYDASAKSLEAERDAAFEAAVKAYADAMDSLDKVGAKDPESTRQLAHAKQRLAEARYKLSGGKDDVRDATREAAGENALNAPATAPKPGASAPVESGTAPAGDIAMDQSTPEGLIALLIQARDSGELMSALDLTHFEDPAFKSTLASMIGKLQELDGAMKAKFNTGLFESMAKNPMMKQFSVGSDIFGADGAKLAASDFKVATSGTSATATHPKVPVPVKLISVNGQWFVDAAGMGQVPPPGQDQIMQQVTAAMGKAIDEVVADINSGKLTNANNTMAALMQKMMAAMAPPPGGG